MRSSRRVAFCVALGMAAAFSGGSAAQAYVKSSITIDAKTGIVLQQRNADAAHAPASLSKMMTLYLVFEALSRRRLYWNTKVTISRHAATRSPVKLYFKVGQRVRVRDLVYATGVKSANDAAAALAEKLAGSEGRFARLMTIRARQLGMRGTVFRTASGLPAGGQRTTARDMAILTRSLIRHYPRYYRVFSTRYYRFGRRGLRNTNRLLHTHRNVDGGKTGYTRRARYNLVTTARRGRTRIITVVLGASSSNVRYRTTSALLARSWRKARSVQFARKKSRRRIVVASRSRVGGGYKAAKRQSRIVAAKKRQIAKAKRNIVVASATKRRTSKATSALTRRTSSKKKVRLTLASAAAASSRASGDVRYVYETKRVVRFVKRRVTSWQNQHGVQVGAFYGRWRAKYAIQRALKAMPRQYRRYARSMIDRQRSRGRYIYRGRLMGFTKRRAQRACYSLRRRGVGCAAVYGRVAVTRYVRERKVVTVRVRKAVPVKQKAKTQLFAKVPKPRLRPSLRNATKPVQVAKAETATKTKAATAARTEPQQKAPQQKVYKTAADKSAARLVARIKAATRSLDKAPARSAAKGKPRTSEAPKIAWKPVSRKQWAEGSAKKPKLSSYGASDKTNARKVARKPVQLASADTGPSGRYAIQVGAFTEYKWAKRGIRRARKVLPSPIKKGKPNRIVERKNNSNRAIYRARITGMSRDEAKKACDILKKQSLRCLAIRTQANG